MSRTQSLALKVAGVLWLVWGLVHLIAGVMILSSAATGAVQAIADAVPRETLVREYPPAAGAILNQHGWNLGWAGLATLIGALFVWRGNSTSIWVTGMIGGLFDIGYFLFIDLGGFAQFVPGTVMTIFSGSAIVLSFWVWLAAPRPRA